MNSVLLGCNVSLFQLCSLLLQFFFQLLRQEKKQNKDIGQQLKIYPTHKFRQKKRERRRAWGRVQDAKNTPTSPKNKTNSNHSIEKQNKTKQKQSTLKTTFLSVLIFNLDSHRFHVVTIFGLLQNTKIFVLKL